VALSEIDRNLLERCVERKPRAWEDFVDRFMGLVVHVANHTVRSRSLRLGPEDREDLCAAVFLEIIREDFAVLRHFRRQSSLATYLAVVARRVIVHELLKNKSPIRLAASDEPSASAGNGDETEQRIEDREEVERLLEELEGHEADVVRMFHLEGKSYEEIGNSVGIATNSVGPLLSRARDKMRRAGTQRA
jgi:RNA polymerase sigma-70 factor, ECF subfamily